MDIAQSLSDGIRSAQQKEKTNTTNDTPTSNSGDNQQINQTEFQQGIKAQQQEDLTTTEQESMPLYSYKSEFFIPIVLSGILAILIIIAFILASINRKKNN